MSGSMDGSIPQVLSKSNDKITAIRKSGTSLWIDTTEPEELRRYLAMKGVLVQKNGTRGLMAKPALTLTGDQASTLLSVLQKF